MGKITVVFSIIVALVISGLYFVSQANPALFGVQMSLVTWIAFLIIIGLIVVVSYDDGK